MLEAAELDEYELLCVRGASPIPQSQIDKQDAIIPYWDDIQRDIHDNSSYDSYETDDGYYRLSAAERREVRRKRDKRRRRNKDNKQQNTSDKKETEMCFKNYKGICADAQCLRSHEFRYSRKMEICKFFLTNVCVKNINCTYMHDEFPCKYYYLGISEQHDQSKCPFMHGEPLTPELQKALINHIEKAPRSILGDFPSKYQRIASQLLYKQHDKWMAEKRKLSTVKGTKSQKEKKIKEDFMEKPNVIVIDVTPTPAVVPSTKTVYPYTTNLKYASQLVKDIISMDKIEKLAEIGIEYAQQIDHLTVGQLAEFGLSISQIHEIQMRFSTHLNNIEQPVEPPSDQL